MSGVVGVVLLFNAADGQIILKAKQDVALIYVVEVAQAPQSSQGLAAKLAGGNLTTWQHENPIISALAGGGHDAGGRRDCNVGDDVSRVVSSARPARRRLLD